MSHQREKETPQCVALPNVCLSARSKNRCNTAFSVLLSKHYSWHLTPDFVLIAPLRTTTPATVGLTDAWLCCWKVQSYIKCKWHKPGCCCSYRWDWLPQVQINPGSVILHPWWIQGQEPGAPLSSLESFHSVRGESSSQESCPVSLSTVFPLCQRCPVCDMCVFLCGYPPSTLFTRHPRPPLCEDSFASLSDLLNNSGSWNRHTDIGAVQRARQLRLLWKPRLYTHTHTRARVLALTPDLPLRQTDVDLIKSLCLFMMISKVQWEIWL